MSRGRGDIDLTDTMHVGVFFVTADDLQPLRDAAGPDLVARHVDLSGCEDKPCLLQRIAVALDFPDHIGRNWDALSDSLRDLAWLQAGGGYVLLFERAHHLRDADESAFETLLDILDQAALDWADRGIPFRAFLALPDDEFETFGD